MLFRPRGPFPVCQWEGTWRGALGNWKLGPILLGSSSTSETDTTRKARPGLGSGRTGRLDSSGRGKWGPPAAAVTLDLKDAAPLNTQPPVSVEAAPLLCAHLPLPHHDLPLGEELRRPGGNCGQEMGCPLFLVFLSLCTAWPRLCPPLWGKSC